MSHVRVRSPSNSQLARRQLVVPEAPLPALTCTGGGQGRIERCTHGDRHQVLLVV